MNNPNISKYKIRENLKLLGIKNPSQLGYKKLSYFYWKQLKKNTGNIKKSKQLIVAIEILQALDISLIKKILIEEKDLLFYEKDILPRKNISKKSTSNKKDDLIKRMSKAFYKFKKGKKKDDLSERTSKASYKNKIGIKKDDLINRMSKAFYKNKNIQKDILRERIPIKSGNDPIDCLNKRIPKSFYENKNLIPKRKRYINFLDELDQIERIWKELYSKNSEFSYSYGMDFYLNFLRKPFKFINLDRDPRLMTLELPFLCNRGHYRTSTFEELFKNYACPECKSSSSKLYSFQVKEKYKDLSKEFNFDLNTGKNLFSLLKHSITWRCQNHRNHLFDATISQRLFNLDSCQYCKTNKKIRNQTKDLIIKEDLINKKYILQCKNNHNYGISLKNSFHKKIECPICKRDIRRIKVNNWRNQDKSL